MDSLNKRAVNESLNVSTEELFQLLGQKDVDLLALRKYIMALEARIKSLEAPSQAEKIVALNG